MNPHKVVPASASGIAAISSDNTRQAMDADPANSGNLQQNLAEGMIIAKDTLQRLTSALQTLEEVEARNKMLEKSVISSVHEKFDKLLVALKNRKSVLLDQIKAVNEINAVELRNAVKGIEKLKEYLQARVAFAEGVLQSSIVHNDRNLDFVFQLVADLNLKIQNEDALDSLKNFPDISFNIDLDQTLETINNLGMVCRAAGAACQTTPDTNVAFMKSPCVDLRVEDGNTRGRLKDCAKAIIYEPCEFDFGFMNPDEHKKDTSKLDGPEKYLHKGPFGESDAMLKKNNALLQSLSSPDVIIEEIIEEDQPYELAPQSNTTRGYIKGKPLKNEMTDCKPKRLKKGQKMKGACAPFSQKKSSLEIVHLSRLIDPCNFYIHRMTQKTQLIMLERMLATLSQTCSQCFPNDVLQLGEIVGFKSIAHNKWCRGSIIELIPLESKCILKPFGPTKYKIEDITHLSLFLLDYGGTETFVAARFSGSYHKESDPGMMCEIVIDLHKVIIKLSADDKESIRFLPPFAIPCSLDLVPHSPGGSWTKEINDHFLKTVGSKCVLMKILREESNMLIVDLKKPFDSKIKSSMPLSLREALVFSEMAKFPSNISPKLINNAINYYQDPILPENSTEVIVVVCHANDPSDFFIHVAGDLEYGNTTNKIQDVYNSSDADDWQVLCPVVGQACVCKFDDDMWYRAEIIALPSAQEADIKYVDFGNISKVNISCLRSLKEEFMALPIKAICCRLAYVQPLKAGQRWSPEACSLFEMLVCNKRLRCYPIGVLFENKLSVELFDEAPSAVTSVNTVLVEGNVACFISNPSDSGDHTLPIKEVWDPVLDLSSDCVEQYMDNFSLSDRQELDVFVSHVVSPSKIYVRWLTSESILKSLQASLCDRYEKSLPEAVEWQVDMQVAVQSQSDEKWMRGKVINIISDNVVQVFCYDFGLLEVTEATNLRTLDESLMEYGTICLECSLMDIQPAGGCQNWTATACDYVSCYLTGAIATMVIEDNASVWPLPVKILIKNEAGKKVDVSESLVSKGLALRDRRIKKHKTAVKINDISTSMSAESGLREPDPEDDLASDSQPASAKSVTREQSNAAVPEKPAKEPNVDEPYLPPLMPEEKTFSAKVSHVGDEGTIYVIQECLENERGLLMIEIQNSFKCLGLMAPYTWKKGAGCLIKGSDTMSYRGTVLDIHGGDMITVQYEDFGYTEKIPKCHLYPSVYAQHIPGFCIPCQLNDILPIGDHWQPDAIQFLRELLKERLVTVHIVESPKDTHDITSVRIYCGYASVSAILKVYNYGIPKGCEKSNIETACIVRIPSEKIWQLDCEELLRNDMTTPWLPKYSPTPLPRLGELFEVKVTHFITPNKVSICITNVNGDDDPVKSILKEINSDEGTLPEITDFRSAMPCLARYNDGLLHRAKLQSIKSYDPVTCLVEFVDFGTPKVLESRSIFQLPPSLIQYPAKAIKVTLAGFKPPKEDRESCRIPYCPEWSVKALYKMMDLVQGKKLFATCIAGSKNTVFLYNDSQHLVHKPLIDLGLADIEEM